MSRFGNSDLFSLRRVESRERFDPPVSLTDEYDDLVKEIEKNPPLFEAWSAATRKAWEKEIIAKYAYTHEHSKFYKDLNARLRNAYMKGGKCNFPYYHFARLLKGQTVANTDTRPLYPGLPAHEKDYVEGDLFLADQFLSCSTEKEEAKNFMGEDTLQLPRVRARFSMEAGVDEASGSWYEKEELSFCVSEEEIQPTLLIFETNQVIKILGDSFSPTEREYLIPHGLCFEIMKVKPKNEYTEIYLEPAN